MIELILDDHNVKMAYDHLLEKKNSKGKDGILLHGVMEYYELNHDLIHKQIMQMKYKCKTVQLNEMINYKGKKRIIALMSSIDRLLARAIYQVIDPIVSECFSNFSYAYQDGKGVEQAIRQTKQYVLENRYIVKIDIENFFDELDHEIMLREIKKLIHDEIVVYLLNEFIHCEIEYDYIVAVKNKGLIQGNSLSPVLSNLYLNSFDHDLEKKDIQFVRYGDDICLFTSDKEKAYQYMNYVKQILEARYKLRLNRQKSGVFEITTFNYLGYQITKDKNKVEVIKKGRYEQEYHSSWYSSHLRYSHHQYHLLNDGILSRKDYSLLFENESKKVEIPVEVVDHINVHSSIIFSSSIFEMMNQKGVNINFFDKHGSFIGEFIPNNNRNVNTTLNQATLYNDATQRLKIAKAFVNASIHNEKSNLKYYNKHLKLSVLDEQIQELTNCQKDTNECTSYNDLLLIEARAKKIYYSSMNYYINNEDFKFYERSKRPPLDPINALISFGNTVLYNIIANEMYKTTIDIRIGYLHAANQRKQSLNLDLADVLKPIIVDRVIFTLINKNMITIHHFESRNNGVYLNDEGKKIFIEQFYKKLYDHITYEDETITYYNLIRKNIYSILQYINEGKKLKLFKYR